MKSKIKLAYFGSNNFSNIVLLNLIQNSDIELKYIVTKIDKKQGRGHAISQNPLVLTANKYNIPVFQVSSLLKDPTQLSLLDFTSIDLAVVVSFAFILPYDILSQVKKGFINLHPSMLPKYRGSSPIQQAIINGDTILGIAIMLLDEGMDTGPVLKSIEVPINSNEVYPNIETMVIKEGSDLLINSIKEYMENRIIPKPQREDGASVTKIIKKEDGYVTLNENAIHIYNKWRAFYTWPGVYTTVSNLEHFLGFKLKLQDTQGIIKLKELVLNLDGTLGILKLQLPNKPVISYKDFLNGYRA